jgi:hypothetical protein
LGSKTQQYSDVANFAEAVGFYDVVESNLGRTPKELVTWVNESVWFSYLNRSER